MNKMKKGQSSRTVFLLCFLLSILVSFPLGTSFAAQKDFPKKEITIIVPLGPGGSRDITTRAVGSKMSKYLGVPVVVRNMPGAGGALGITNLYRSSPDGYTIGISATPEVILQLVKTPEFDMKKFSYIGKIARVAVGLFVKADSPFKTIQDLKTFGKPIRTSTHSYTSNSMVAAIVIADRIGFPLVVVGGYRGGAAAVLALVRGEVEVATPSVIAGHQLTRAGKIRPIVIIDKNRCPFYPDVPTVGEAGYPELGLLATDLWFMAPPGVPKARIKILEEAFLKTMKNPDFSSWAQKINLQLDPMGSQKMKQVIFDLFEFLKKYKKQVEKYVEK